MADAADSKSAVRKGVRVQVPPSALQFPDVRQIFFTSPEGSVTDSMIIDLPMS